MLLLSVFLCLFFAHGSFIIFGFLLYFKSIYAINETANSLTELRWYSGCYSRFGYWLLIVLNAPWMCTGNHRKKLPECWHFLALALHHLRRILFFSMCSLQEASSYISQKDYWKHQLNFDRSLNYKAESELVKLRKSSWILNINATLQLCRLQCIMVRYVATFVREIISYTIWFIFFQIHECVW